MELKMYRRLKNVLSQQSYSRQTKQFRKWIQYWLKINVPTAKTVIHDGNLYVTKGNADVYPCIISHIDTVHSINPHVEVHECNKQLYAFDEKKVEQYGIGGDDKVGVWIALEMLLKFDNIKAVFFRDEEIGCLGSGNAVMTFFDDCGFALQADRRGYGDFIDNISGTELSSDLFKESVRPILQSFGYKFQSGMITDVGELKDKGLGISVANISCAYYHPHSSREYVNVYELSYVYMMMEEIVDKLSGEKFAHKSPNKSYRYAGESYGGYSGGYGGYGNYSAPTGTDWAGYYKTHRWDSKLGKYVPREEEKKQPTIIKDLTPTLFDAFGQRIDHSDDLDKPKPKLPLTDKCWVCEQETMLDSTNNQYYCFSCQDYVTLPETK